MIIEVKETNISKWEIRKEWKERVKMMYDILWSEFLLSPSMATGTLGNDRNKKQNEPSKRKRQTLKSKQDKGRNDNDYKV